MDSFSELRSRRSSRASRRTPGRPSAAGRLRLAAVGLAAVAALVGACASAPEAPDATEGGSESAATADTAAAAQPCLAPATWFPQSQTPKPDPDQPFASFCDFHQWAWQSFLWLTQTVEGGRLRFETFPTLDDVIAGRRVSGSGPMKLAVRTQKADAPNRSLDEVTQADSAGVLVDQDGRAGYYSQLLNPQMFEDIVGKGWNDPAVLEEIPPDTEFETGDVELKAIWKIVAPGEDTGRFYVRPALVDRLALGPDGTIVVDQQAPPLEVRVALVGFHVVGWVNGHPEAVWASFEQDDNAPDFAPDQSPTAPVSDRGWTFYAAGTQAQDCNQVDTQDLELDPATQTLTPVSQVCRQFPHGMVAGTKNPTDLENLEAITSLNASVKSQIGSGDLFGNYFEVGAIWTDGDLQPNNDQQANLKGSTLLNNSVIETFTQNTSGENNCFWCHNTLMYNPPDPSIQPLQGTNINLSHIILEAYIANQPNGRENR